MMPNLPPLYLPEDVPQANENATPGSHISKATRLPLKLAATMAIVVANVAGCASPQVREYDIAETQDAPQKDSRRFLRDYNYTDEQGNAKNFPIYENAELRRFEGTDTYPFTVIPEQRPEFERAPGKTQWTHIGNAKDLIGKIEEGPKKIIIMISSSTCHPCHKAMKWWEARDMGPYEAINYEPDDDNFEYLGGLEDAIPQDLGSALPRLFVIDTTSLKRGEKFHRSQIVQVVGSHRHSVTYGLAEWLNKKGY